MVGYLFDHRDPTKSPALVSSGMFRSGMTEGSYPDVEVEILVSDRFDVEPNRRYRCDDLADLESI
jgi:hypothetical protein